MLCQNCNKRTASVHLTQINNGEKTEVYLCEYCAQENADFSLFAPFNISDLFSGMLNVQDEVVPPYIVKGSSISCEKCGLTFEEFKSCGRLGCSNCYKAFDRNIAPVLKRIHNGVKHTGKMPSKVSPLLKLNSEVAELKSLLDKAVLEERYEDAAKLRDRIRLLTHKKQEDII